MDISVSHLNNRLALQLPTELPLGLVFVTGSIANLSHSPLTLADGELGSVDSWFDLIEVNHILRCQLSPRALNGGTLKNGAQIRAGGHLTFDPQRAGYYLLARDIEIIQPLIEVAVETAVIDTLPPLPEPEPTIGRRALTPILADIKRRSEVTKTQQGSLPPWVHKMAPPEVQQELKNFKQSRDTNGQEPNASQMNDKLLTMLSEAMESSDDVELTKDMLAILSPSTVGKEQKNLSADPYQVPPPLNEVDETEHDIVADREAESDLRLYLLVAFIVFILLAIGIAIGSMLG